MACVSRKLEREKVTNRNEKASVAKREGKWLETVSKSRPYKCKGKGVGKRALCDKKRFWVSNIGFQNIPNTHRLSYKGARGGFGDTVWLDYLWLNLTIRRPGRRHLRARKGKHFPRKAFPKKKFARKKRIGRVWGIAARRRYPSVYTMRLVNGKLS